MNIKLLTSTLAGGLTYFLLGFLVYGVIFMEFFTPAEGFVKEPMAMWAMAVSCLVWALLIAIVCQRWADARNFKDGAIVGSIIGALMALSVNLSMFSMYTFVSLNTVILDFFLAGVTSGISGGVIGWVLGRGKLE